MRKYCLAKNIVVLSLFSFYEGSSLVNEYFNCTETFKEENLNVVVCLSMVNKAVTLPRNLSTHIEGLYILSSQGTLMIEGINTFQRFPNLMKLQMFMRKGLKISDKLLEPVQLNRLLNELFRLPRLEVLVISHIEFNSKAHPWVLPESLKSLLVSNSVFEYDLRKCSILEMLELHNNDLQELPIFCDPPPPLKRLNLSRNPLRKLSLNDIAAHCDLQILGLDGANLNYCECLRLLQWIRNMKEVEGFTFLGSLECDNVEDQNCTEFALQEAVSLREKCVRNRIWNVAIWFFGLLAISAITILACCLIVYKLRKIRALSESGEE